MPINRNYPPNNDDQQECEENSATGAPCRQFIHFYAGKCKECVELEMLRMSERPLESAPSALSDAIRKPWRRKLCKELGKTGKVNSLTALRC